MGELQLGLRYRADHIGWRATEAGEIAGAEAVGRKEGAHATESGAGAQVVQLEGVAVKIGSTITAHGGGVSAIGEHNPTPGVEITAIGAIADGLTGSCIATSSGLLISDAINDEARFQQPAVWQLCLANGGGGGLAVSHQAGAVGVGIGCGLRPKLDRVGRAAATRCCDGREGSISAANALLLINHIGHNSATAVAVDCGDGGAWHDAKAADAITGIELTF